MAGVERRMLDRIGEEVARATSIVRYAPGSKFSAHVHGGGEEFLVLDGVFQDEHGDYGTGTYVRNPPHSSHTPRSDQGCTIFVKLWQFDPNDRAQLSIDTAKRAYRLDNEREGVKVMSLFANRHEDVRLERWAADAEVELDAAKGLEALVLEGAFEEGGGERFEPLSWLRLPAGARALAVAGGEGARVWIKQGHLARPQSAPSP
jgi:hypothetical protein